jgi:hypothetical protein
MIAIFRDLIRSFGGIFFTKIFITVNKEGYIKRLLELL